MKKGRIGVVFLVGLLVIVFFPKPSSQIETNFAVQQRIRQGMSEQEAKMQSNWNNTYCECLGFEKPDKLTSYTTSYVCWGIVTSCRKIK